MILEFWTRFSRYMKGQTVYTLAEIKARITAEVERFTKDILQRVWQQVDYMLLS